MSKYDPTKSLGEVAYEAYHNHIGNLKFAFDELPEVYRAAWSQAAAEAVRVNNIRNYRDLKDGPRSADAKSFPRT